MQDRIIIDYGSMSGSYTDSSNGIKLKTNALLYEVILKFVPSAPFIEIQIFAQKTFHCTSSTKIRSGT